MNADRLFALYDRVADAPDAVDRLRRFVLDLAVRGSLVEQDPADEPASELLRRIASEKTRLVKAGKRRRRKPPSRLDERPFSLPWNWHWARIREVVSDRGQRVPDRPFTYIDVSAIDKKAGLVADPKVLEPGNAPSRARKIARPGDVVYSCVRPYLLNVAIIEDDFDPPPIASTAFEVLNGHGLVLPRYTWMVLRSSFMIACVEQSQRGQAYPAINSTDFAVLPFPLPPSAEQHRVVAKVDELMALCDRLEETRTAREEARDRLTTGSYALLSDTETDASTFRAHARFVVDALPALTARADQVKHLRQTILNLAVRGKLVEQDPSDEPVSELLKRIAEDKKARGASARDRQQGPGQPVESAEQPYRLPQSWVWVSLGDITISRDRERVPVSRAERKNRAKVYDYYGASGVIDKIDGYLFDKPLLLIGEDGANLINRSKPIAFIARGKYWVNNHAHVLDGLGEDYLRYLALFINATDLRPFVTGTAQPKMNQKKMNSIPVALPPLPDQLRIVAKVDQLMALCDRLEAGLARVDGTRNGLLESLLHESLGSHEAGFPINSPRGPGRMSSQDG